MQLGSIRIGGIAITYAIYAAVAAVVMVCAAGATVAADVEGEATLRSLIASLARTCKFSVSGAYRLEGKAVETTSTGERCSVARLLSDYNYALVKDESGTITKLIITGRRQAVHEVPKPRPRTIKTEQMAGHHVVSAILTGRNGHNRSVRLVIDTGASAIVLPRSMAANLGYDEFALPEVMLQTANGQVAARMAVLKRVAVGKNAANDVAAAFLDDKALAGKMLLGMSFLGHFKMTIDQAGNRVTLEDR